MKEFLDTGAGGIVSRQRVVAVGRFSSSPVRRAVRQARKEGRLINLTYGRACKWVFFLDSGHVVLVHTSDLQWKESENRHDHEIT
jgi:regulator of extracellular matrix RemA (YlzA/DUF370 family)